MQTLFPYWDVAQTWLNSQIGAFISMYNQNTSFVIIQYKTLFTAALILLATYKLVKRIPKSQIPLYIRDFQVFTANDPEIEYSNTKMLDIARVKYNFRAEPLNFMRRVSNNNGLGPKCCIPPNMVHCRYTIDDAREEAAYVMFPVIDSLLKRNNIKPTDIDVLVTNCSLFCPTPSLAAMIINHFKMKHQIHNFSLGGMGCSASPCGTDLVQHFMQNKRYKYALHISTENITQNFYKGRDKSMLLPNALFRIGCAAVLYTNDNSDKQCKYEVKHIVRTHIGANDEAYKCVYQKADDEGKIGVFLARSITSNAIKCLTINMRELFMKVLPLSIKLDYVYRLVAQKIVYWYTIKIAKIATTYPKPLLPKVERVVNNFCFHTGGRAVIDGMQNLFALNEKQIEASRAALFRYGNTSSASIWYELAYHESTYSIKKNNIIWQIAFGSGFKTNSLVLKSLVTLNKRNYHKITWFDQYDREFRFSSDQLVQGEIQQSEKDIRYEDCDAERDRAAEEQEWQRVKQKYGDRFLKEMASGCDEVKQVQQME